MHQNILEKTNKNNGCVDGAKIHVHPKFETHLYMNKKKEKLSKQGDGCTIHLDPQSGPGDRLNFSFLFLLVQESAESEILHEDVSLHHLSIHVFF